MTYKQVKKSIDSGYLELNKNDSVDHYKFPLYTLLFPILFIIIGLITGNHFPVDKLGFIVLMGIPAFISLLSYLILKRKLKLKKYVTTLSKQELDSIIKSLAFEMGWVVKRDNKKFFMAEGGRKPNLLLRMTSSGSRITIIFRNNAVYVNSVCIPSFNTIQLTSFGINRKYVKALFDRIKSQDPLSYRCKE